MGRPAILTWTLCVALSWMCVGQAAAGPQFMVAFPAVLEVDSQSKLCGSFLNVSGEISVTITLRSKHENTTIMQEEYTNTDLGNFHSCTEFKVPSAMHEEVRYLEVEVQGKAFYSKQVRKVLMKVYRHKTFVQTDKPIYLPGQTVHFRVVTVDAKLRPANGLYNIIELEDPAENRIGQWLNETSNSKILQLSYHLNNEAMEGFYKIIVTVGESKTYHNFKVEKYVLPKFDVTVNVPEQVSVGHNEFEAEVCAKYTYGQPVPGSVTVEVCRPLFRYYMSNYDDPESAGVTPPCHTETKQADKNGCATFTLTMSAFTKVGQKAFRDNLNVSAKVEEEGTGISRTQEKRIGISYVLGKVSFFDMPKVYTRGISVEGKVKAVYYNNTPIVDALVHLFEGSRYSAHSLQNVTTDSEGVASFSLKTDNKRGDIHLHASLMPTLDHPTYRTEHYETGAHTIPMSQPLSVHTKTVSELEVKKRDQPLPCDKEEDISIHYTIVGEAPGVLHIVYLAISRGVISMQGSKSINIKDDSVNEGVVSFKLRASAEMTPDIKVVAYVVLSGENVIADRANFPTEKCFSNKVSLEFSPSSAVPGEEINMQVTAQPHSLCGVSAVDKSVLIKEPGKTLTAEKIFDLLPVRESFNIPYQAQDQIDCLHVRPKRYIRNTRNDAFTVFQSVGLKMATNLLIRDPDCIVYRGREYHYGRYRSYDYGYGPGGPMVVASRVLEERRVVGAPSPADDAPLETVRSFFPETWIWDLVEVGEHGTKDVPLTVPDTITTWETETFCLSSQGFGLAPREEIRVFQPFFLGLTLPYSIIRGEHFVLKATVFNYMNKCIMVAVTPTPSLDYTLTPLSGDLYTSCLCSNERKTLSWTMNPTALGVVNVTVSAEAVPSHVSCDNEVVNVPDRGRIDVVTKSLIVKAEGVEMTKTHNWLLCPKGDTLTDEADIQLPENVIQGSARASVSVLGDILGRALKNLDGMLQMPYGCGEQNMALLAPNIYILQYLKGTQQLTPEIMKKATNYLTSGYQRQLNYKHHNGAYSTFGTGVGNTWLTAFVLRSFAKAQAFIYIDPTNIEASKTWLERKQRQNGCFEQSGKLFNNRMKGGVSDEVTLSAYITAAFLEMNISAHDPVVNKSLLCLKESLSSLSNTYTTALMAYVFTMAGDMETRAHLLQHLDTVAMKQGGFTYWSQKATDQLDSLSVEISSYVLMAKLSASPTAEDLGYASGIVRWLTGQQNYYGGFSSTQDTVVALQALALYSTLVFSPEGSSTVTVQAPHSHVTFDVNKDNKLVYQEKSMIKDVSGKYSLEVKGTTCAAVQISLHYNIPTPAEISTLQVQVVVEVDATQTSRTRLTLKLKSQYSGKETTTNMVILDIKMLSGHAPDPESLKKLKGALLVDRVEQKEDHVLVYLTELPKDIPINHSLEIMQQYPVDNLKAAVVKIYDYYQPSDQAETEYTYPR
ncbi:alpha-2-macroglobulin-like [Pholidichthys leucotaenia]